MITDITKSVRAKLTDMTTGSANRRIFGAALIVGSLTFVVKLGAMVKESFVAAYYGTSNEYDAFIIALLIPSAVVSIIAGSFRDAMIPTYIEVREQNGVAEAQRLFSTVLVWNLLLLFGVALILACSVHLWLPWIASGFSPQKLALSRSLFFWSLPIIIISGLSSTWGAILNAGERFGVTSLSPAMYSIAIIASLLIMFPSLGIFALLIGTVLGASLDAAIVGLNLYRRGYLLMPRWFGTTSAVRQVRSQYAACIANAVIMTGVTLVDQGMASMLGPSSNSALSYGGKLISLVSNLGAMALATAILPHLSRLTANNDWKGLRRTLKTYMFLVMGITIPVTLTLIYFSSSLIRLIYQRGAFSEVDTQLVASVQSFSLIQLPFMVSLVLVTRSITALKANHILIIVSIGLVFLNALLNYIFMAKIGVVGIALSTSVCLVVVFIVLTTILYRHLLPRVESTAAPLTNV